MTEKMTEAEFRARLATRAAAVQAARLSLVERVREFVAAHGRNGSKTGRADYSAWIGLDQIHKLTVALDEYDRVRSVTSPWRAADTPEGSGR